MKNNGIGVRSMGVILFLVMGLSYSGYGQVIEFEDENFKDALVNTNCVDEDGDELGDRDADLNDDGEIDVDEALLISALYLISREIMSLEGINYFENLEFLRCSGNDLTELDVSGLSKLEELNCIKNDLLKLNISGLNKLRKLDCSKNHLEELNLSGLDSLRVVDCSFSSLSMLNVAGLNSLHDLDCSYNLLTHLNLSGLEYLEKLHCSSNFLNELDLSKLVKIENIDCSYNNLSNLTISGLKYLEELNCSSNILTELNLSELDILHTIDCDFNYLITLDLTGFSSLNFLTCFYNDLTSLFIKTGSVFDYIGFSENPELSYICCDEHNLSNVIQSVEFSDMTDVEVNTYCSFSPGGQFYNLQGKSSFDGDGNGCDNQDISLPIKFEISDGQIIGTLIPNASGNFNISVGEGEHTITAILEDPEYFEVSPPSLTVSLPSTSDTIVQDFCITPKGNFSKIDITILPLAPPARPGFTASYKIQYENIGNQIESGIVGLSYDEEVLDYVSASQLPDLIDSGELNWYFTDLLPFEKGEIVVSLNVNSPMETPPVNVGDLLIFEASANDNFFRLVNTVVGSYDPNDKTCLQGNCITPDMIGENVDYLIRFENTGNYAAENVVVKDEIDPTTFDISTLQITDASHEVYARIRNNTVEFIFEDIQLPFDDETNDGYVAFEVKTWPSLTLGDTLSNLADIYFDFNPPIRTNETVTRVVESPDNPPVTECFESAVYNYETCVWEVSGEFITSTAEDFTISESESDLIEQIDAWLENIGGANASDNCGQVSWTHDYDYDYSVGNHWVRFKAVSEEGLESEALLALLSIQLASAIGDVAAIKTLSLSPNPAQTLVTINNVELGSRFQLFSIDGQEVMQGEITESIQKVDLTQVIGGVYSLIYYRLDGQTEVHRLIKI